MSQHLQFAALLLALVSLFPAAANADVFKCVAANGELTFSQTPCQEKDSKVTVQKSVSSISADPSDCENARRFALTTAQQMKAGTDSSTLFDSYGGLSAMSRGSVSLVSYVYQYRTNSDVSAERVAALSMAKCQARAFGDVSCEQLPVSFTSRQGGCNKEDKDGKDGGDPYVSLAPQPMQLQDNRSTQESDAALRARNREAAAREEERRLQCRDRIKKQIDSINAQMRGGYSSSQGESMKKKRRDLEEKLRDC